MSKTENISWPGWETVKLIGRGSFGEVYLIERKVLGDTETAALKVISIPQNESEIEEMYGDGYDDESITSTFHNQLKSIVAEYSLMRKLKGSRNIVSSEDIRYVQHDDGIGWDVFIKMELLTPLLKTQPAENLEEMVTKLGSDICNALVACKEYDIVHRDIKPQNIFVSKYGDYKLGDFGIAKTVERTMGGTKIGTYKYMAPEVFNNRPYGSTADIYSLGLVMYWMLNEHRMPFLPLPPVKINTDMETEARQRRFIGEQLPPPVHGSEELKAIVLKACAFEPKDRYATAEEMMAALGALKEASVVVPPVDPVPEVDVVDPVPEVNVEGTVSGAQKGLFTNKKTLFWIVTAIVAVLIASLLYRNSVYPKQKAWSDWVDTLPKHAYNDKLYETETRTLYSVQKLETVESTESDTMPGWQFVKKGEVDGFTKWSPWSMVEAEKAKDREIETQKRWRYRDLEKTTSKKKNLEGWKLDKKEKKWEDYGAWSKWSTEKVTESDSRQVETKKQYRYRTKSSKDGKWSDWSDWSTTKVSKTNTREVKTRTLYRYRDRDYTIIYHYFKWGEWSKWSPKEVKETDTRKVQSRDFFRYRDPAKVTVYYFEKWGSWSEYTTEKATPNKTTQVQTKTEYRFRSK